MVAGTSIAAGIRKEGTSMEGETRMESESGIEEQEQVWGPEQA
jgi:hypothetical protein